VSKHILVIDDDVTSLDIVSYLFEERGYEVRRCADGRSAVAAVQDEEPDLIIVDLLMPEINGIETVQAIRKLGVNGVPVIAFTAVEDEKMHQDALAAGCNVVLTKPCPIERLVRQISAFLPPRGNGENAGN
jgi:two-component system response regulator VicR